MSTVAQLASAIFEKKKKKNWIWCLDWAGNLKFLLMQLIEAPKKLIQNAEKH